MEMLKRWGKTHATHTFVLFAILQSTVSPPQGLMPAVSVFLACLFRPESGWIGLFVVSPPATTAGAAPNANVAPLPSSAKIPQGQLWGQLCRSRWPE